MKIPDRTYDKPVAITSTPTIQGPKMRRPTQCDKNLCSPICFLKTRTPFRILLDILYVSEQSISRSMIIFFIK